MAFDPDQYLSQPDQPKSSGGFDPDAYLSGSAPGQPSEGVGSKILGALDKITDYNPIIAPTKAVLKKIAGAPEAALEHFGNQAALGYLPQLEAATEPAFNKVADLVTGNNVSGSDKSTYLDRRDQEIKRLAQEAQDNPAAAKIGDVGGMLAGGAALSAAAPIEGANWIARAKQAAKVGGAVGAIANPGDTEGEVSPLQIPQRAVDAAGGAAIGGAVQGAAEGLSSLGQKGQGFFADRAGNKAAKAIGIDKPAAKVLIKKYGQDSVRDLGQSALDNGLIGPLSSQETIASRAANSKDEAGQAIGSLLDKADAGGAPKVSAKDIALNLADDPGLLALKNTPGMEGQYDKAVQQLQTLYNNGDALSLRKAQELRIRIDRGINFGKAVPELRGTQENLYNMRDQLSDNMNDAVNSYNGDGSDELKTANRKYSDLSRIQDIAEKRMAGNAANRAAGLTDTIAGAGGADIGATIGAAAGGVPGAKAGAVAGGVTAGGLNKLARTYGPSLDATTSNALAKILKNSPDLARLAASNPAALPMIAQSLARQDTPAPSADQIFGPTILDQFKQRPDLIDNLKDPKLRDLANKAIGRDTASVPPTKEYVDPESAKQQFLRGQSQ